MKIKSVKIKNFRGYGENKHTNDAFFVFENLDKPVILLNGFNGFGKTSFFEAIEWCLTDKIKRLNKFSDVYEKNTLKQSYYLKFRSPNGIERNRTIEVEIEFDDGTKIKRTSKSCFLSVSDADSYTSDFYFNGRKLNENNRKEFCDYILNVSEDEVKNVFIDSHFLNQENLNEFLRTKRPEDRKKVLMQLLSMIELEDLNEIASTIKRSNKLTSIVNKCNTIYEENKQIKAKVDELFSIRKWANVESYIKVLNEKLNEILLMVNEQNQIEILDVKTITSFGEFSATNCTANMEKIQGLYDGIYKYMQDLFENKRVTVILKDKIEMIILIQKALRYNQTIEQLNLLKNTEFNKLDEQIKKVKSDAEVLNIQKLEVENKKNGLEKYCNPYREICNRFLNEIEGSIKDEFWNYYEISIKNFKEFISQYEVFCNDEILIKVKMLFATDNTEIIKDMYKDYSKKLSEIQSAISSNTILLNSTTGLNKRYSDILINIKKYIIENKENIDSCPVCKNDDFTQGKYKTIINDKNPLIQNADILIKIIDSSISQGDKDIETISQEITSLNEKKVALIKDININILSVIMGKIEALDKTYREIYSAINTEIENKSLEIKSSIDSNIKSEKDITDFISRLYISYKNIFGQEEFDREKAKALEYDKEIQKVELSQKQTFEEIREKLSLSFIPTEDELKNKLNEMTAEMEPGEYEIVELYKLIVKIKDLNNKLAYLQKVVDSFKQLLDYKLSSEYGDLLKNYNSADEQMEKSNKIKDKAEKYNVAISKIIGNISDIQKRIFKNNLEDNQLINWIYKEITPHPFYKELRIMNEGKGAYAKDASGDIFLDQIFSTAQLNVLVLSIFMGLGLVQKYSKLEQLFLDDPIQSMDDVNILSLIDVFRAVIDSNLKNKGLIISTHDDNFARLLSIKLRNREYTRYTFLEYGEEGPIMDSNIEN